MDGGMKFYVCFMSSSFIGFTILVILMYTTDIFDNYRGNGTSSGGYSGVGRPGGGRGSGGGYCFSMNTIVWTKNESLPDEFANEVMVKDVKEGDLVGTLDTSLQPNKVHKFMWTRATDVTIYDGDWMAHNFSFTNGRHVTVTSPHLMIIKDNGAFYFLRADDVQIGDEMVVDGTEAKVSNIRNFWINSKVAIETEEGTIQANGVLASGLCDENPDPVDRMMPSEAIIRHYKTSHFGKGFNEMCMDTGSWKKAYNINNRFID